MSAGRERHDGSEKPRRRVRNDGNRENAEGILDLEVALRRIPGGKPAIRDLAQIMLEECPRMLCEVRAAWHDRDADRLRKAAHALRGSADVFAARHAVQAASRVEKIGHTGTLDGADAAMYELEREVGRLSAAIRSALATDLGET
jgi:HPt (histidine-containing phosphotransfer) domain-containing protein